MQARPYAVRDPVFVVRSLDDLDDPADVGVGGLDEKLDELEGTANDDPDGMGECDLDPCGVTDDDDEGIGECDRDELENVDEVGVLVPGLGRFSDDLGMPSGVLNAPVGLGGPVSLLLLICLDPGFKRCTARFKADFVIATCVC